MASALANRFGRGIGRVGNPERSLEHRNVDVPHPTMGLVLSVSQSRQSPRYGGERGDRVGPGNAGSHGTGIGITPLSGKTCSGLDIRSEGEVGAIGTLGAVSSD